MTNLHILPALEKTQDNVSFRCLYNENNNNNHKNNIKNNIIDNTKDTLPHFPGRGPISPGCAPVSPGCTGLTMKLVGVQPSQPEMQNLVGVEISALKSDWGALQAHEKGGNHFLKIHWGWHKISTFQWSLRSIPSGLHYFP